MTAVANREGQVELEARLAERCRAAVDAALKAGADQAEAYASSSESAEVALEKGDLQLARSQTAEGLGLRVFRAGQLGFAATNQLGGDALGRLAHEAVALAKQSPSDPFNQLPETEPAGFSSTPVDPRLWQPDIEHCVEWAKRLLERVRALDPRLSLDSGSVEASAHTSAVCSSAGAEASESDAGLSCRVFGMAIDGSDVGGFDYRGDWTRDPEGFLERLNRTVDRFAETALGNLAAKAAHSYRGRVLLTPEALASLLLSPLLGGLSAMAVQRGTSPLAGKLGQAVAGSNLTLIDDPQDRSLSGASRFDREGLPTARLPLVSGGRLETYLYNAYAARVEGRRSTGHASGGSRSVPGIGLHGLSMAPGSGGSDQDLLGTLDRGLLVGRFSGTVDPASGDFSGVAKSARWIEGGRVVRSTQETLLQGNAFEALFAIEALSSAAEVISGAMRLPWALVDGISVTAG